jgi:hypothetical protein
MKSYHLVFKAILASLFCFTLNTHSMAQSIARVVANPPDGPGSKWTIDISFVPVPAQTKIKQIFLVNIEDAKIIKTEGLGPHPGYPKAYTVTLSEPLEVAPPGNGCLQFAKHYELKAMVENVKGDENLSLGAEVILLDKNCQVSTVTRSKVADSEDADVYISGELNGARKRQTSFNTEIKLQRYKPFSRSWRYKPFFGLSASTDPDADPDTMGMGIGTRYIQRNVAGVPGAYLDNDIKIESERDFSNTNLIYDARFILLPSLRLRRVFFSPFIGAELGKNLRSPLQAAEGNGIARPLAGAKLRFVFYPKGKEEPDINWVTSYTRRWLLTDELGFKAEENGDLQLSRFGKSPRDYVLSKFSYSVNQFLDVFVAYEWGQVPPSYKFIDHRFRLGFAYKYQFSIK